MATKKRKGGNRSGNKGKGYEREIAKLLTPWVGFPLIRTPMSGAWSGSKGDIVPKNREQHFPFTLECKKQEGWDFHQIFQSIGPFFLDWLPQTLREAKEDAETRQQSASEPLLIFSQNYKPDYICFNSGILDTIPTFIFRFTYESDDYIIMLLSTFLKEHTYQSVLQKIKVEAVTIDI